MQDPPVNAMSINNKNYGRGKIVMLALMMVTSTFAAIGTTAAGPSGKLKMVTTLHMQMENMFTNMLILGMLFMTSVLYLKD